MKSKAENISIRNIECLSADLTEIIEKKHLDLLRVTNCELVTLFWLIGKELNLCLSKNSDSKYSKLFIRTISFKLSIYYGSYFTEKNLKNMGAFANQFSDFYIINKLAPFISWEQTKLLLSVRSWDAKLFYIRLTIEQGLNAKGLRKHIFTNTFKDSKQPGAIMKQNSEGTKANTHNFLQIFQLAFDQTTRNKLSVENLFKDPLLPSFLPLITSSKDYVMPVRKPKKKSCDEEEMLGVISKLIKKYRYQQNSWVNSFLNLSFAEIGKRINQETFAASKDIKTDFVIRNTSEHLRKKIGEGFTQKRFQEMAKFAEQFDDSNIAVQIACLVTWPHILALSSLPEMKDKLFYAKLTATQGLSVVQLKELIVEKTKQVKEIKHPTIVSLKTPISKTTIKKKGNSVFSTTKVSFDIEDSLVVTNIFKNPYLPLLTFA